MSIAARRSHRGDDYQLLIALHWIIRLIQEEEWVWIELEAISLPEDESKVFVDDIIIGHSDGSRKFIQAKKNQPDHRNWSVTELKDELLNAREQLEKNPTDRIIFYSRTPFGDLGKLIEDSDHYRSFDSFKNNASNTLRTALSKLTAAIERSEYLSFKLLKRMHIGEHHSFEGWERLINNDLIGFVHDPDKAFAVLERFLRRHQSGRSGKFRITRNDVISYITKAGLPISPNKSEEEILREFKEASSIGRESTSRDIAGIKIHRKEIDQIISALEDGKKKVIVTGSPGCGKSCILLELVDILESKDQIGVLFVKGEHYDKVSSEDSLLKKLKLQGDIVGLFARLSSYKKPIMVIDSLDAISLARDQKALKVFLALIDRLSVLEDISVVVACRNFDLNYDPLLRDRKWDLKIEAGNLDFDENVIPFLKNWKMDVMKLTQEQKDLLTIPRNLKILERIVDKVPIEHLTTSNKFTDSFIDEIVIKNPKLGNKAFDAISDMANKLLLRRSLFLPKDAFKCNQQMVRTLESEGVIQKDEFEQMFAFVHQTLIDTLVIRQALANGQSLEGFVLSHPPLPFIRPSIRAFLFYLRSQADKRFLFQVKNVFQNSEIAYHIKRLIAESLAEIKPAQDDLKFFQWLLRNYLELFRRFLFRLEGDYWYDFFSENIFEEILSKNSFNSLRPFLWGKLKDWMNCRPYEVVHHWKKAADEDPYTAWQIGVYLNKFERWETSGVYELLDTLLAKSSQSRPRNVGYAISRFVEKNNTGDDLLWKFITSNIDEDKIDAFELNNSQKGLNSGVHDFHNENFLPERISSSDYLLSQTMDALERWSAKKTWIELEFRDEFLSFTSWRHQHSGYGMRAVGPLEFLLDCVSAALSERSKENDLWWREYKDKLCSSSEAGILYLLIRAYRQNILNNIQDIEFLLARNNILLYDKLSFELEALIKDAFPYFSDAKQEELQKQILGLKSPYKDEKPQSEWILNLKYRYSCDIPAFLRIPELNEFLQDSRNRFGEWPKPPILYSWGGTVVSPVSAEQMLSLSDQTLMKLLTYYDDNVGREHRDASMTGGTEEVVLTYKKCCSLDPIRFIPHFESIISSEIIIDNYAEAIIGGITDHIAYRFGIVQPPSKEWHAKEPLPEGQILAKILLNWIWKYDSLWGDGHLIANAIRACCQVVEDSIDVQLIVFCQFRLAKHYDPVETKPSIDDNERTEQKLATTALNSVRGVAAEGTIILASNLLKNYSRKHELLFSLMHRFAMDSHPAVRVSILKYLPYYTQFDLDGGWKLFEVNFRNPHQYLWHYGERFLYYQYHKKFDKVKIYLERIKNEAIETAGQTWGRISTLAYLAGYITEDGLFNDLVSLDNDGVWTGLIQVFTSNISDSKFYDRCENGLLRLLEHIDCKDTLIQEIDNAFELLHSERKERTLRLAIKFIDSFDDPKEICEIDYFYDWLLRLSYNVPYDALQILEILFPKIEILEPGYHIWNEKIIGCSLNILRQADLEDNPEFISRAIALQDRLIRMDLGNISEVLDEAARVT